MLLDLRLRRAHGFNPLIDADVRRPARRPAPPPDEPRLPAHLVPVAADAMTDVATLVDALTARLRPLEIAANQAWWTRRSPRLRRPSARRVATDIAVSDVARRRRRVRSASATARRRRRPRSARRAASSRCCTTGRSRTRSRPTCGAQIVELQVDVDRSSTRSGARSTGTPVDDNDDRADPAHERRHRRAAARRGRRRRQVGAEVADRVRELARLRNEAARAPRCARPLRPRARDQRARRDPPVRDPRRGRRGHRRAVRGLEGRARRAGSPTGSALPVDELRPWHYDDPFFQDPPAAGAVDLDPLVRGPRPRSADASAPTTGSASTSRRCSRASDLFPRPAKSQHAFCIDMDHEGDVRVLSNDTATEYWAGDDAARVRPRHLRRRGRPRPAVAAAHDAPAHHRGRRDAVRAARPRRRVARRRVAGVEPAELDELAPQRSMRPPRAAARRSPAGCS